MRSQSDVWRINAIIDSIGTTIPQQLLLLARKELSYALAVRRFVGGKESYELSLHTQYLFILNLFDEGIIYRSDYNEFRSKILAMFFKRMLDSITTTQIDSIELDCSSTNINNILRKEASSEDLKFLTDESLNSDLASRYISDYYSLREPPNFLSCIETNLNRQNYEILPKLFKEIQVTTLFKKAISIFDSHFIKQKHDIFLSLINSNDSEIKLRHKIIAAEVILELDSDGVDIISDLIGKPGHFISSPYLIELLPGIYKATLMDRIVSKTGISDTVSEILVLSTEGGTEEVVKYLKFIISTGIPDLVKLAIKQLIEIPGIEAGRLLYDGRFDSELSREYNFALKRWMIQNQNLVIELYKNIHGQSERSDFIRTILIEDTIPSVNIQCKMLSEVDEYHKQLILKSNIQTISLSSDSVRERLGILLSDYLFGDQQSVDPEMEKVVDETSSSEISDQEIEESTRLAIRLLSEIDQNLIPNNPVEIPSHLRKLFK